MTVISAGDLTKLRSKNHKQIHYLSIFKPETVLTAQVNDAAISRSAMSITFDSGVGDISLVKPGMTLEISTADGIERLRIRSITGTTASGTINVAQNAVVWADNQVLTIKQEYLLWAILPRFEAATEIFWKDYDITYTDQTTTNKITPICIMGSNRAKFLTGASVSFNLDGSNSYSTISGATLSYSWESTAGTIASPTSAATTISFTSTHPDGVIVSLTVTDNYGNSQISHRLYFVHSPNFNDSAYPLADFDYATPPQGSWDSGGWRANIQVSSAAGISQIPDGTPIVIWQEAEYGSVASEIGLTNEIVFSGFAKSESIVSDTQGLNQTTFEVGTIESLLKARYLFSVSLEVNASPSQWYHYNSGLTTEKAVHFFMKWHSTLLEVADVYLGSLNRPRKYCLFEAQSLYSAINSATFVSGTISKLASNKAGILYLEQDVQILVDTERALVPIAAEVLEGDRGVIKFNRVDKTELKVAKLSLSGFYYDGVTNTALESAAPGIAPNVLGASLLSVTNQTLPNQTKTNELSGRLLAKHNNSFKNISFGFTGNWTQHLDIVPQNWWTISLTASDTNRNIIWNSEKIVPREITLSKNIGVYLPEVTWEKESLGQDGVTVDSGSVPDSGGTTLADLGLITAASTRILDLSKSSWTEVTTEATNWVEVDPWWRLTNASTQIEDVIYYRSGVGYIKKSLDGGTTEVDITPSTDPPNKYGDSTPLTVSQVTFSNIQFNNLLSDDVVLSANGTVSGSNRSWMLSTFDGGTTWGWDEWWLAEGVDPATVYGAYKAVGASSYNDSLVNRNSPGTNDLSTGTTPTWGSGSGWTFNSSSYLTTTFVPQTNMTIIAQWRPQTSSRMLIGEISTERFTVETYIISALTLTKYKTASYQSAINDISNFYTYAFSADGTNRKLFLNGVLSDTASTSALTPANNGALWIGAVNTYPSGPISYSANFGLKAIAIYTTNLTDSQISAISAKMGAL